MNRRYRCAFVVALGTLTVASFASAQTSADPVVLAQLRYEREVARCNSGALAAPAREACIRSAGLRLDRARGMTPPVDATVTTPDGRATVVAPVGAAVPSGSSNTSTSRDGRATVVR